MIFGAMKWWFFIQESRSWNLGDRTLFLPGLVPWCGQIPLDDQGPHQHFGSPIYPIFRQRHIFFFEICVSSQVRSLKFVATHVMGGWEPVILFERTYYIYRGWWSCGPWVVLWNSNAISTKLLVTDLLWFLQVCEYVSEWSTTILSGWFNIKKWLWFHIIYI